MFGQIITSTKKHWRVNIEYKKLNYTNVAHFEINKNNLLVALQQTWNFMLSKYLTQMEWVWPMNNLKYIIKAFL